MNPLLIGLLALGVGLGPAAAENRIDRIRPDAPELAPYGPHPVGLRTVELVHADQIDIVNTTEDALPRYDRPLTVSLWYPAAEGTEPGGTYHTTLRDGETDVPLTGRAVPDAEPAAGAADDFPLVIVSHGYPGNRFLLSPLAGNLASKGYVVASIDHTDSTYSDMAAFGSTLVNRPVDQGFVIDRLTAGDGPAPAVRDLISEDRIGVLGYSMGAYGALIFGGAGVSEAILESDYAPPQDTLTRNRAGSDRLEALIDPRVKAIIAIAPWGREQGFWDAEGLAGLRKPTLLMAGSVDAVAGYASIRRIFEQATGADRHLLTFANAGHNAAAPMPAPEESLASFEELDIVPFEHYADAVWNTVRMNNIAQHFATAFFDWHLKQEPEKAAYFDLVERAEDGVWSREEGEPTDADTYWKGFPKDTAHGLRMEVRAAE